MPDERTSVRESVQNTTTCPIQCPDPLGCDEEGCIAELMGGVVEPIILTPDELAYIDWHVGYVAKRGKSTMSENTTTAGTGHV